MFNNTRALALKYGPRITAGVSALTLLPFAHAVDSSAADGATAVTGLIAGQAGYLAAMIGLALAAVGIMIAVKWVKRARGAA